MRPKMYYQRHDLDALRYLFEGFRKHMKPKYEIGQEVYYKGVKHVIEGIKLSYMVGQDYLFYLSNGIGWIYEKDLTLDNKKYYILYRSADGLEMTEQLKICHEVAQRLRRTTTSGGSRLYNYTREDLSDDCKTSTYIYDEVI